MTVLACAISLQYQKQIGEAVLMLALYTDMKVECVCVDSVQFQKTLRLLKKSILGLIQPSC